MIWKWIKSIYMFPVQWFWKRYRICKKKNAVGDMILLFLFSLTGIVVAAALTYFVIAFLVAECMTYPVLAVVTGAIVWLYIKGKEKEVTEETTKQEVTIREQTELEMQSEQGYASMLNVMFQTIRAVASDVGGITPTFMGEIEMPEGRYRLRDGICFYTFMLEKQDIHCIYNEGDLNEFRNTLQFKLHNKLNSGAFPSIKILDFRDAYGGMDGVIVHAVEDYGRFFVIYSVYASSEYSEYRHQQELLKTQRSVTANELTTSWEDMK